MHEHYLLLRFQHFKNLHFYKFSAMLVSKILLVVSAPDFPNFAIKQRLINFSISLVLVLTSTEIYLLLLAIIREHLIRISPVSNSMI